MSLKTARHELPLLAVGQAQKEYSHNEALLLIDNLLNPSIVTIADNPDTLDLDSNVDVAQSNGKSWLISNSPSGVWENRADQIAVMSPNGWRYIAPVESMQVFNEHYGCIMVYKNMSWIAAPKLLEPASGEVVDSQSRAAILAIINALEQFGLSRS